MTCKDLTNQRFGRLTVVSRADNIKRLTRWNCLCDCGTAVVVYGGHLKSGATKSCGCYNRELTSKRFATHRKTNTRLFRIWQNMHKRCTYKKHREFHRYGGRGISVCKEWDTFDGFYKWATSHGYCDNLTLDRVNPNGNYEPNNCQWLTRSENTKKAWRDRRNVNL